MLHPWEREVFCILLLHGHVGMLALPLGFQLDRFDASVSGGFLQMSVAQKVHLFICIVQQ